MTGEHDVAAGMPSAFGGSFDLQDFYGGFRFEDITPQNMQSWPYYKHVSAHWPEFVQGSSQTIRPATKPIVLEPGERFDLNGVFRDGKTYLQSLLDTQVKGFIVLRNSEILAEFYDNGFNVDDSNLLQSASKTIVHGWYQVSRFACSAQNHSGLSRESR